MIASIKAFCSVLGLLNFFAGLIEKAQLRELLKKEQALDDYEVLRENLKADKDLVDTVLLDPALRARLRKLYSVEP